MFKKFCQPPHQTRTVRQRRASWRSRSPLWGGGKPISISLSPNTQKDDVFLALRTILQLWNWKSFNVVPRNVPRGSAINAEGTLKSTLNYAEQLEENFKQYLGVKYAFAFNSGRSALMAILSVLEISKDEEILIQAFTCNAVPNPIIWQGARPVYVDIDETLNIDPDDLEKKITPKSRAIILQHTFGVLAQIEKILTLAECYNLKIIEDCAHSLGAEYGFRAKRENHPALSPPSERAGSSTFQPRYASGKAGTFGDVAFFSFGRDKVISCVYGGMVATNNPDLAKRLKEFQEKCGSPSNFWTLQQLLHPIIFAVALPTYYFFNFGKFLIWFCQKIKLLSKAVTKKEKKGENPDYFPQKMSNALAILALNQLKKLNKFNEHRRKIAEFYENNLRENFSVVSRPVSRSFAVSWKYPIFMANPKEIRKRAKKEHIILDDGWWGSPVVPPDTDLEKMKYKRGDCPKAEKIAKTILNLPTHINISIYDAQKIINSLKTENEN